MAVVANLAIAITARTKKFNKGMRRVEKRLQTFTGTVGKLSRRLIGFSGALAGIGAGVGLSVLIKNSFKAIDATAKLADRIGMTTEALTGLQHAGRITGVGVEGVNKSVEMMARRLGEAKYGTGEATDALKRLGLGVKGLLKLRPKDQFMAIADAMGRLGTQAEKADTAAKLFGRSGVAMVNLIDQGTEGIERLIKQNEALGGSFGKIDSGKIEKANDAITCLRAAVTGLANRFAILLAPRAERMGNALTKAFVVAQFAVEEWEKVADLAMAKVAVAIDKLERTIMHFAKSTLPALFGYIDKNYQTLLGTMADNAKKILGNIAKDIFTVPELPKVSLKGVAGAAGRLFGPKDALGNARELAMAGRFPGPGLGEPSLTRGVDWSAIEWPELPERKITPAEKALADTVDKLQKTLGEGLKARLKDLDLDNLIPPGKPALGGPPGVAEAAGKKLPRLAGALQMGSVEEYSARVQGQYRMRDQNFQRDTAKNTARTVTGIDKVVAGLKGFTAAFHVLP